MIKAILFDFDGTLADTLPYYVKAYRQALGLIGFPSYSEKEIVTVCFGKKEADICNALNVPEETKKFSESYFNGIKQLFKSVPLFDKTMDTLMKLKEKNISASIITFQYRWYMDMMMKQYDIAPYIDKIISADDVKHPKPNPEAITKFCTMSNLIPEECLMVGDSRGDILMGKTAGSKSVLFHPNDYSRYYNFAELEKTNPDFIIQNIEEVFKFI